MCLPIKVIFRHSISIYFICKFSKYQNTVKQLNKVHEHINNIEAKISFDKHDAKNNSMC